ncbi:hypothetical protein GGI12_003465, partial [Dipsacomyces acuminosporus]
ILLAYGADVHVQNEEPLREAAERGHLEIIRLLLSAGSNVHVDDEAPLRSAARGGHLHVVRELIAQGAVAASSGGTLALRAAARAGWVDVVQGLIHAGADAQDREFRSWALKSRALRNALGMAQTAEMSPETQLPQTASAAKNAHKASFEDDADAPKDGRNNGLNWMPDFVSSNFQIAIPGISLADSKTAANSNKGKPADAMTSAARPSPSPAAPGISCPNHGQPPSSAAVPEYVADAAAANADQPATAGTAAKTAGGSSHGEFDQDGHYASISKSYAAGKMVTTALETAHQTDAASIASASQCQARSAPTANSATADTRASLPLRSGGNGGVPKPGSGNGSDLLEQMDLNIDFSVDPVMISFPSKPSSPTGAAPEQALSSKNSSPTTAAKKSPMMEACQKLFGTQTPEQEAAAAVVVVDAIVADADATETTDTAAAAPNPQAAADGGDNGAKPKLPLRQRLRQGGLERRPSRILSGIARGMQRVRHTTSMVLKKSVGAKQPMHDEESTDNSQPANDMQQAEAEINDENASGSPTSDDSDDSSVDSQHENDGFDGKMSAEATVLGAKNTSVPDVPAAHNDASILAAETNPAIAGHGTISRGLSLMRRGTNVAVRTGVTRVRSIFVPKRQVAA